MDNSTKGYLGAVMRACGAHLVVGNREFNFRRCNGIASSDKQMCIAPELFLHLCRSAGRRGSGAFSGQKSQVVYCGACKCACENSGEYRLEKVF